jgi:hypothetical protein
MKTYRRCGNCGHEIPMFIGDKRANCLVCGHPYPYSVTLYDNSMVLPDGFCGRRKPPKAVTGNPVGK